MQLTQEQCDTQIAQIQQQIPELQARLQRLLGYKQAVTEMSEDNNEKLEEPADE
jgi:hypothetical protein